MNKVRLLLVAFAGLFPALTNAEELHYEFINRCLLPLGEGQPFITEGLVGPFNAPDLDILVPGAAAVRTSWQFPSKNWSLGTITAGSASVVVARACGITVYEFEGTQVAVLDKIMSALGLSAEYCQFELEVTGKFGIRSVLQSSKSGEPVLVNFSPLNDGGHVLMAWQVSHERAASPCGR